MSAVGTSRMVPVMIGRACAGFLVSAGPRGIEAYDRSEKSLGIFPDAIEAATAIEKLISAALDIGGART